VDLAYLPILLIVGLNIFVWAMFVKSSSMCLTLFSHSVDCPFRNMETLPIELVHVQLWNGPMKTRRICGGVWKEWYVMGLGDTPGAGRL